MKLNLLTHQYLDLHVFDYWIMLGGVQYFYRDSITVHEWSYMSPDSKQGFRNMVLRDATRYFEQVEYIMTSLETSRHGTALAAVHNILSKAGHVIKDLDITYVGSAYISGCTETDVDILVLIPSISSDTYKHYGWDNGGSEPPGEPDQWTSYKKFVDGVEVNMILTNDEEYYKLWVRSAEVARFMYLSGHTLTKGQVHGIHQIVMDGGSADVELQRKY